jgi:hypothetical protein
MAFNLLNMFDKLDDIIYKPIELVTDWAKEPLRSFEHKRIQDAEEQKLIRDKDLLEKESEIKLKEKEKEFEFQIRKETEVIKILTEIEEWKKDEEFRRNKDISEAIIKFQQDLQKINRDAINCMGNMQLELREKAQKLVYEKTVSYKDLQRLATQEAMEDFKKINEEFKDDEFVREILGESIRLRLSNIINTAHNFLLELNKDIGLLNSNIDLLTKSGQNFIQEHLSNFNMLQGDLNLEQKSIKNKSSKYIDTSFKVSE